MHRGTGQLFDHGEIAFMEGNAPSEKYARNLSATSFIISIYCWSGAEIAKKGILGGIMVKVNHPVAIELAAILLLGFFFHQFCIANGKPWISIKNLTHGQIKKQNKLRSIIIRNSQKLAANLQKKGALLENLEDFPSTENTNLPDASSLDYYWVQKGRGIPENKDTNFFRPKAVVRIMTTPNGVQKHLGYLTVSVSFPGYFCILFAEYTRCILKYDRFWKTLFPFILFSVAVLSIFVRLLAS